MCGIVENIQMVKMEFPDCYRDLRHTVPEAIAISQHLLEAHGYSLKMVIGRSEVRAGFSRAVSKARSLGII